MKVADKNEDQAIDHQEVFYGLRAWHAWNNMPKSVGAAFTRYKIGQGLPMPSVETLKEAMLTLNECQPVEQEEVEYVHSLATGLGGASAERASTDQMRKAIAAWYLNVERSETTTTDIAMASFKETHKQLNVSVINLKEKAAGITSKLAKGGSIVDQAVAAAGPEQGHSGEGSEFPANPEEIPFSPAGLFRWLQESSLYARIFIAVVMLILLPYLFLVFYMLYKVTTLQRSHSCEADLRFPMGTWVATEMLTWALLVYSALVEKYEGLKKCFFGLLGLAKVCILIMGILSTEKASRENCNAALYDTSEFLFIYVPLFVVVVCPCTVVVAICMFLYPSFKSTSRAESQLAGMNA